jgi:hypothetical protein
MPRNREKFWCPTQTITQEPAGIFCIMQPLAQAPWQLVPLFGRWSTK